MIFVVQQERMKSKPYFGYVRQGENIKKTSWIAIKSFLAKTIKIAKILTTDHQADLP
jgi:hypothetical protein